MGPLSRLIGRCIERVKDASLVYRVAEEIVLFARTLGTQWRQNKFSEIDVSQESVFLADEALRTTVPRLWEVLKACMFTCVNVLKVVIARTINDPILAADQCAFLPACSYILITTIPPFLLSFYVQITLLSTFLTNMNPSQMPPSSPSKLYTLYGISSSFQLGWAQTPFRPPSSSRSGPSISSRIIPIRSRCSCSRSNHELSAESHLIRSIEPWIIISSKWPSNLLLSYHHHHHRCRQIFCLLLPHYRHHHQ